MYTKKPDFELILSTIELDGVFIFFINQGSMLDTYSIGTIIFTLPYLIIEFGNNSAKKQWK